MSAIDELLATDPYGLSQAQKRPLFMAAMYEAYSYQYLHSPEFHKLSDAARVDVRADTPLVSYPYLPVPLFKTYDLRSVPDTEVVKTLASSATSGRPSKVFLDQVTIDRQRFVLSKILHDVLGNQKRQFYVFDHPQVIAQTNGEISSRGTAIRGFLAHAGRWSFLTNERFQLDAMQLEQLVNDKKPKLPLCLFGFTWVLYTIYETYKTDKKIISLLHALFDADSVLIHIGGWKKLTDKNITKPTYNQALASLFGISENRVIDVYGMTEQLGTVYPDCTHGHKHASTYSEIIIRDPETLLPVPVNGVGLIQLLSPIPHSYPGISILSDDLGRYIGIDDCPCGRRGTYFVFERRAENAELKGCGDTIPS